MKRASYVKGNLLSVITQSSKHLGLEPGSRGRATCHSPRGRIDPVS